jgi:hypothetical protein
VVEHLVVGNVISSSMSMLSGQLSTVKHYQDDIDPLSVDLVYCMGGCSFLKLKLKVRNFCRRDC